jgi:hypothetical protein
MSTPQLLQTVVIALVVSWATLSAARRLLPVTSRRVLARIAHLLDRPASPAWLQGLSRRIEPLSSSGGSCGDGCSSCGGCGSAAVQPAVPAQPLVFRPRAKG